MDTQTMKYFGEDPCKFRHFGETEATFGAYHFDEVSQTLVRSWAACALNENCIAPPGTASKLSCSIHRTEDGRCHRFDQAVLSLMLRRLYHEQNDYPQVPVPINLRVIERGSRINYFPID
ncbi:hypothetical protein ACJMK2_025035 [Sinanodonta woodiana]|uniref:Uncharacterized protein n=1 Tax=Sinanodonta woodiana TaxID=1069815 RepID=A0ABD3XH82_SINWO